MARRADKAASLASEVGGDSSGLAELAAANWDVLVNATPIGSDGVGGELALGAIRPDQCVFDMVTTPEQTSLIQRARTDGARTITGIEMLAAQAVHQAELWTGERPSVETLAESAR